MKLIDLLSVLPFYQSVPNNLEQTEVTGIEMDSRKVIPGSVFVCIKGFTVDGHDFVKQAIEKGAVAIIAQRPVVGEIPVITVRNTQRALAMLAAKFYHHPTNKLPLIGVTGTNGKTTVTYLLEKIFQEHNKKTGIIGTIQLKIGDEVFDIQNTTPDALTLQKVFSEMVEKDVEQVIMEVSSHALDQGRVYGCDYDIAVFTNLSQDHLDYHKDMADYLRAKSLLFAQLGNTYGEHEKFAVINADDTSASLLEKSTAQQILTYACEEDADIKAENIRLHLTGTTFDLKTPVGTIEINSSLIGLFNVYNMLAASGAAIAAHVPLSTIKLALEHLTGVNGRFESVVCDDIDQPYGVIVDFAHTPDSLENVLKTISEFKKGKVYVVVGCGGDRDKTKRPLMAQIACEYGDYAILTSDNPRTEKPEAIIQDMVDGLTGEQYNYKVIVNRKQAIYEAVNLAQANDIVLIAGKGHETYQIIGREKTHFDDREIAREAIKRKGS
ncbi:UDP-N-acetylmuramoyl-L-alanyl-D-glutamate--2,6-diaminopimelate ligase [Virgibacillus soli]|uniref:UDP-N-acetylmuramoyl-L-alanyl-D-glutamate--2, 6-diaminopimelate ligase n=1 Tax=Paracerasibacillus soli TaxID=480284 RepID=UPI0035EF3BBE